MFLPAAVLILAQTATDLDRLQAAQQRQLAEQQRQQAALTQELLLDNDRLARVQVQKQLDTLALQYRNATPAERAALQQRMQVQQANLGSIAQHERLTESQLVVEIERLRTNLDKARGAGLLSAPAIQRRQFEIQHREDELARIREERQQIAAAHEPPQTTVAAPAPAGGGAGGIGGLALNELETRQILLRGDIAPIAVSGDPSGHVVLTLPETLFQTGSAALDKGAHPTLDRIAGALKAQPGLLVRVAVRKNAGDRDSTLAEQRALAARDYLIAAGVPRERVSLNDR